MEEGGMATARQNGAGEIFRGDGREKGDREKGDRPQRCKKKGAGNPCADFFLQFPLSLPQEEWYCLPS
jgi:hypothetical protein